MKNRQKFDEFDKGGNFLDTHGEYTDVVRLVILKYKGAPIDMHCKSEAVLKKHDATFGDVNFSSSN